ncbi:MAG: putative two-component system response regulator [Actinomycetia bacterium]|nr:putative two-component system response regulator [Actinomycetes bacterium]
MGAARPAGVTAGAGVRTGSRWRHPCLHGSHLMADPPAIPGAGGGDPLASVPTLDPMVGAVEVVLVEDDDGIGSSLVRTLVGQGYLVTWAHTAEEALAAVETSTRLVILDLGLPDRDGLEVCRELRDRAPALQILILTARSGEGDVVLGLDAGADDYLAKPFGLAELLARVRACTRRIDDDSDRLTLGGLTIDVLGRTVTVDGVATDLRPKEFDLLVALARNVGRVVRREQLLDEVWDEHWFGSTKTLDIHIWALRRKLDAPESTSRITTVRGVGYRIDAR